MAFNSNIKQFATPAALAVYLDTLPAPTWGVIGTTGHNTYKPTEAQWIGAASMRSMQAGYEAKGWSAGPHFYLALGAPNPAHDGIWQMTPPTAEGVHGVTCNRDHFGIELVGDFQVRAPSVAQQALFLDTIAVIHRWARLGPLLNMHRDCVPRTCPGDAFYALKAQLQVGLAKRLAPTTTRVIGVAPSISLLQLQTWLNRYHAPLSPVDAEHVYRFAAFLDIDPAFVAAIWQHETSANGAIGASALYRLSNNAGAIRAYGRWPSVEYNGASWNAYESPQLGLMALVFHLKQLYGAAGSYEVETIIPQYAPAGDGNAPQAYIDAVRAAMQEMRNI